MGRLPFYEAFGIVLALAAIFPRQVQAGQPVVFEIDGAKKQPISPYIYGTNQPDWQGHGKYLTLTRWGGNRITAYNWETNASNAGSDWQHQNDGFLSTSDVPGEPVRKLVADAHAAGASVIVTVPMAGYVAADKAGGGDVQSNAQLPEDAISALAAPQGRARSPFRPICATAGSSRTSSSGGWSGPFPRRGRIRGGRSSMPWTTSRICGRAPMPGFTRKRPATKRSCGWGSSMRRRSRRWRRRRWSSGR